MKKSSTYLRFMPYVYLITIAFLIALFNYDRKKDQPVTDTDGYITYEVVILGDHDVVLYNTHDITDSLYFRLENAYNLIGEWMIQVK